MTCKSASFFVMLALLTLVLGSCQQPSSQGSPEGSQIDSLALSDYLSQLSSDAFMGRKPLSEGEPLTTEYLKNALSALGVAPGNGDSYFQDVPLIEITGRPATTMQVKSPSGVFELQSGSDYTILTQREQELVELKDAELVFCGYGIVAPEYGWNDYAGIDMKGKVAVVMVNDPGFATGDSTLFKGKTMTYYGRWTYKYEEAARQGAEAVLIIHETNAAGYPWFVVAGGQGTGRLNLQSPNGNADQCAINGWMSLGAAAKVFQASGLGNVGFFEKAQTPGFQPIPLGITVSTSLKNTFKKDVSRNVVGLIKGSKTPDEYVIYSAHWDHLGVGRAVEGDSIYNGALDNASGTAAVLAIAKAFAQNPTPPERSVVFLFVTAEEQGLLGSAYYAANPIFSPEQSVANLNMDGMNPNGRMRDLTVTGYGQSDLDDIAGALAAEQGRYIIPDQEPEKGYFFRSDHFNFAKIGIPALFAKGGYDHWEKGKEYAQQKQEEFVAARYHQPSDEFTAALWDLGGVVQDAELYLNIGKKLANSSVFPKWKEGSEFKAARSSRIKD
ncbi:MAG: M28 family metallopeptidase [Saprospiraceae bacterium]|nr:M28 family metallopeptidase [Saprospiraceae bacterium]